MQRPELGRQSAATPPSVGVLFVEGDLDALDLVTQLDGGAELQVHALLHGGQSEQQQRLTVDVLHTWGDSHTSNQRRACAIYFQPSPFQVIFISKMQKKKLKSAGAGERTLTEMCVNVSSAWVDITS